MRHTVQFSEAEPHQPPNHPPTPRWPECRCGGVAKGECSCYADDGQVTHGGVHREGFDHGVYLDGAAVRC